MHMINDACMHASIYAYAIVQLHHSCTVRSPALTIHIGRLWPTYLNGKGQSVAHWQAQDIYYIYVVHMAIVHGFGMLS